MTVQRVVILGRGGAGKSTVGRRLSELVGLPVIELDKHFWQPGLAPLSREKWVEVQRKLASQSRWIMDGDLGPYDALPVRLSMADTVLLLDFPLWLCLWRALRRGKENWDFWWWLITWRWLERAKLRDMFAQPPKRAGTYSSLTEGTRPASVQARAVLLNEPDYTPRTESGYPPIADM
jgi:hypothetical protein